MSVKRKKVTDDTGTIDLVMTYSDEDFKLKQEETGIVYGKECIDTIAGYDEENIPYSRYTYTETDEKDEDEPTPEPDSSDEPSKTDMLEMLNGLEVETDATTKPNNDNLDIYNEIKNWVDPKESQKPYNREDKCYYKNKYWVSIIDNNISEPGSLANTWINI